MNALSLFPFLVSRVFTVRRYASCFAVGQCPSVSPSVRLSVCLCVTFVYCIQMAKGIVKLLSQPDSPIVLVSEAIRCYPTTRETHSAGA